RVRLERDTGMPSSVFPRDGSLNSFWSVRKFTNWKADRIVDCVSNSGGHWLDWWFPDSLCSEWSMFIRSFNNDWGNLRNISRRWNVIVQEGWVQYSSLLEHQFLHKRVSHALDDSAVNLTLELCWDDYVSRVMSRDVIQQIYFACFHVYFNFRYVNSKGVRYPRATLSFLPVPVDASSSTPRSSLQLNAFPLALRHQSRKINAT